MKIGLLIPSTSKGQNWKNYKDTYLYKYSLRSFLITYDKEHEYTFYIGIDKNDKIYDNEDVKNDFKRVCSIMKNVKIEFIYMEGITKGHLTVMWNRLFEIAYNDNCEYFIQCGDDIEYMTNGWINASINILKINNDLGVSGPIDINNTRLLTQSIVSRKHMDIFNYYFPPEIINWFCDDWINDVYKHVKMFYPLYNYFCCNKGGEVRYDINNDKNAKNNLNTIFPKLKVECMNYVNRDKEKILSKLPLK